MTKEKQAKYINKLKKEANSYVPEVIMAVVLGILIFTIILIILR